MNLNLQANRPLPDLSIDAFIAHHGAGKVLRAALVSMLKSMLRRHGRPAPLGATLSNHLRRDIGLPVRDPGPRIRDIRM